MARALKSILKQMLPEQLRRDSHVAMYLLSKARNFIVPLGPSPALYQLGYKTASKL